MFKRKISLVDNREARWRAIILDQITQFRSAGEYDSQPHTLELSVQLQEESLSHDLAAFVRACTACRSELRVGKLNIHIATSLSDLSEVQAEQARILLDKLASFTNEVRADFGSDQLEDERTMRPLLS